MDRLQAGQIYLILVKDGKQVYLILAMCHCHYDQHRGLYLLKPAGYHACTAYDHLLDFTPIAVYSGAVSLKNDIRHG